MADNPNNRHPATRTRKRAPRKVSALTAQQAQHKRDLDRKAQRALRQRAKSRLQDLEEDLARAKTDCSVREQGLIEEVQALRDENRRLRSRLESIADFALGGVARVLDERDRESGDEEGGSPEVLPGEEEGIIAEPDHATPRDREQGQMQVNGDHGQEILAQGVYPHTDPSLGRIVPSPGTEGRNVAASWEIPPARDQYLDGPSTLQEPIMSPAPLTPVRSASISSIAAVLPKHRSATCPLDQILLDFISSRRSMAAKGYDMESIVGPTQPPLQAIIHPQTMGAGVHPTSRMLAEVLTTFSHVALPEKLAFMFVMYRTIRISPTEANYDEMPRWLRPTATQVTTPHAAWIDNIPWPRVRDMLIENPDKYPFPVFSELYSQHVTVNWPYGDMDGVSHGANVEFNPIFEKHVRRLENWTVSGAFRDYLPEMTAAIYGRDF